MGGEKDWQIPRLKVGIECDEALGEGLDEGGFFGPLFDEGEGDGRRSGIRREGGYKGAAVETDAGTRILRREADGDDSGDAVAAHLGDDVRDVRMPVAHGDVDGQRSAGGRERFSEAVGLGEGPASKRRRLRAGLFPEADLGVAVLEFLDNLLGEGAATGDFGEVFGHFAEDVRSSVGEEENGGVVVLGHA
jgi:hypothetical protein